MTSADKKSRSLSFASQGAENLDGSGQKFQRVRQLRLRFPYSPVSLRFILVFPTAAQGARKRDGLRDHGRYGGGWPNRKGLFRHPFFGDSG